VSASWFVSEMSVSLYAQLEFGYLRRVTPVCRCLHPFCGSGHLATLRESKAHFCLHWVRPWDNRGKCYTDGKRIQCLSKHRSMYTSTFHRFQVIRNFITFLNPILSARLSHHHHCHFPSFPSFFPTLFHSKLKRYLFLKSFPPLILTPSIGLPLRIGY